MNFIPFDPNNDAEISKKKIEEFYGEFSDSVRARLLSKIIVRPSTVYDILYPQTRETLLSKNNEVFQNLEVSSKSFRDFLLARNEHLKISDLLISSEDIRKSLQARNKIANTRDNLLSQSENTRKFLLSKHKNIDEEDLLSKNEKYRNDLLSKNKTFKNNDLLITSKDLRNSLISKNTEQKSNLLNDSSSFRDSLISKNKNAFSDLVLDSELFRKTLLSKNKISVSIGQSDLEKDSVKTRNALLSKNNSNTTIDLSKLFESVREALQSKNNNKEITLEKISEAFREVLISKNKVINEANLNDISVLLRNNLLSRNKVTEQDLLSLSTDVRRNILSKNKNIGINIDNLYTETRKNLLSKNKNINDIDLINIFESARKSLLSKNKADNKPVDQTPFRNNLLSRNKANTTDLLTLSQSTRKDILGKNKGDTNNFDAINQQIRKDTISKNTSKVTDLSKDSVSTRQNILSNNIVVVTDLLQISTGFRTGLLSRNKSNATNLLTLSSNFRKNELSQNKSVTTDLLTISKPYRNDLLSMNVDRITDLLAISKPYRNDLLAKNVDKVTDLQKISVPFRNDLLAKNVDKATDLAVISLPFYKALISKNVNVNSDVLKDSVSFRKDLISRNVPSTQNLLFDSSNFRADNVQKNIVPNSAPLLDASQQFRKDLISKNKEIINGENLLAFSNPFRDNLLSKNVGLGLVGVNIEAAGTSAFLGISKVLVQGTIYKSLLLSKNKITRQSPYTDIHGKQQQYIFNISMDQQGFSVDARNSALFQNQIIYNHSVGLVGLFGNGTNNGKYYGDVSTLRARSIKKGDVTDAARIYNLQKNMYNLEGVQPGASTGYNDLQNLASSKVTGLNDLIQTTIAGLTSNDGAVIGTPSTPNSIIQASQGRYYGTTNLESVLNPVKSNNPNIAENIVAKSILTTNPFDNKDFRSGARGVRRIVKLIKNSSLPQAGNFDVQNSTTYKVGTKSDGTPNIKRQRFTIANPYSPGTAQKLSLYFKNYANNQAMFFPPYVSSFGHSSTANWNTTNFLGRPEAVYTYNHSERSGTISFFVLTDYSQNVDIGYNFPDQGSVSVVTESFPKHFTDGNTNMKNTITNLQASISNKLSNISNLQQKKAAAQGGETAEIDTQIQQEQQDVTNNTTRLWELQTAIETSYYESNPFMRNVYSSLLNAKKVEDGYFVSSMQDTKDRLDAMKNKLMFQPGYFSGDKVDFVRRVEFLEKMTRPSANDGPGFSFIKPPVCHMHLGDWFNHDIIINNISYDYTNVPWTLDGSGRVQPMWVSVTINFNLIGYYRHVNGPAPSADDVGGYFSDLMR